MKKAAANILILVSMIIGIVLIFFDFSPAWQEGDTYQVTLHTHVYGMSNTLDIAELYADTSLDYSVYQAVYDVMKKGGFEKIPVGESCMAYWSKPGSEITLPTNEAVDEAIRKRIEDNLARYTAPSYRLTAEYAAQFPKYKVLLQQFPASGMLGQNERIWIRTESDSSIKISKKTQEYGMLEDVSMERLYEPTKVYGFDYKRMLDIGREENPVIVAALKEVVETAPGSWESERTTRPDESFISGLKTSLEEALFESGAVFERAIDSDYAIRSSVQDISLTTASQLKGGTYDITYTVAVTLKVEVTYEREYFPVYDSVQGKLMMEKLSLVFMDREGDPRAKITDAIPDKDCEITPKFSFDKCELSYMSQTASPTTEIQTVSAALSILSEKHGLKPGDYAIVVDPSVQTLYLYQGSAKLKEYRVSTGKNGLGNVKGSEQTPWGAHRISAKIGDNAPIGQVFKELKPVPGEDIPDNMRITTRILRLSGLEPGVNQGKDSAGQVVDSFERAIYIHGTAEPEKIGAPASHGCIRMLDNDVLELYNLVPKGTLVYILKKPYSG